MYIKVKTYFYDKHDPSRVFNVGEAVLVNDPDRAQAILSQGLGVEINEPVDYKILDRPSKSPEPKVEPEADEPKPTRKRAKK